MLAAVWSLALVAPLGGYYGVVDGVSHESTQRPQILLFEPVILSDDLAPMSVEHVADELEAALTKYGVQVKRERDILLPWQPHLPSATTEAVKKLVSIGEERYMGFDYGPAAAKLAESAGLLTDALGDLDPANLALLYRVRLLEGTAWLESGNQEAASAAFQELATIHPDLEPDPGVVPPASLAAFRAAVTQVRARGQATLGLGSEPAGAVVYIDGRPQGVTPVRISDLTRGRHRLLVAAPGFEPYREQITLDGTSQTRQIRLASTPVAQAMHHIAAAAKSGATATSILADFTLLEQQLGVASSVVVGIAPTLRGVVITGSRWEHGQRIGAVVLQQVDAHVWPHELIEVLADPASRPRQFPIDMSPLAVDFDRSMLGVWPGWEPAAMDPIDHWPLGTTIYGTRGGDRVVAGYSIRPGEVVATTTYRVPWVDGFFPSAQERVDVLWSPLRGLEVGVGQAVANPDGVGTTPGLGTALSTTALRARYTAVPLQSVAAGLGLETVTPRSLTSLNPNVAGTLVQVVAAVTLHISENLQFHTNVGYVLRQGDMTTKVPNKGVNVPEDRTDNFLFGVGLQGRLTLLHGALAVEPFGEFSLLRPDPGIRGAPRVWATVGAHTYLTSSHLVELTLGLDGLLGAKGREGVDLPLFTGVKAIGANPGTPGWQILTRLAVHLFGE